MASGGADKKKEDDFRHTCGLCMEPYRGRTPKLLPCFHTFCLPCLAALVENVHTATSKNSGGENLKTEGEAIEKIAADGQGKTEELTPEEIALEEKQENDQQGEEEEEEEDSDKKSGDVDDPEEVTGCESTSHHGNNERSFLCPTCRATVSIPQGGVAALQTNFYLDVDDAEDAPCSGPVLCEMCEEDQQQEATHSCRDCQQRMCRSCRRLHDRVSGARDHRVEPIPTEPLYQPSLATTGKKTCQFHSDQVLCFHCSKCDVSICLHCKLTSHEGHVTEDMATAAARVKEELARLLLTANEQIQIVKTSLGRLGLDAKELVRQKEEESQKANARHDVILLWARRARDEFIEDLTSREQMALDTIQSEERSAGRVLETLSSIVSQASRPTLTDPDVVLLKNKLLAALLRDDALDHQRRLAARKNQRAFFASNANQALELNEVRAFIGELVDPQSDRGDPKPSVSFTDLVTRVASLTTKIPELVSESQNVSRAVDRFQQEMKRYAGEAADLQRQMQKSTQMIYFKACVKPVRASPCFGNKLYFEDVQSNKGGGYNGKHTFKAPVAGLYSFAVTVRAADDTASVAVKVDSSEKACACATSSTVGSASFVTELDPNSMVWVVSRGGTVHAAHTTFFGFLIQAAL